MGVGYPDETKDGEDGDSESLIRTRAYERGVLALPGTVFLPRGGKTAYVRASFSLLGEEEVEEGVTGGEAAAGEVEEMSRRAPGCCCCW